ncbi:MAG: hypothetical protein CBD39_02665 [Flavobacteriaceae bacterium TMED179]|nr:MAG: hypothetical protein CBD39_02665 [Flavobacteriaceae bacterium TMED179]|tara:strand:+ start:9626 stop:9862 length:237 start_codon:yes stop_codon:yes gene_type:complete
MKQDSKSKKILFRKRNYRILFIAFLMITTGFVIMTGGGSDNPYLFNEEIFNFKRIRLAPTIVLVGFGTAMYSILTQKR